MPDLLTYGLKVVFVGYNPSPRSAELGHNFAGHSNRFWKILYLAGLTTYQFSYSEDGSLLELGYGMTNIVSRPTKSVAEIRKEEFQQGREILTKKLLEFRPKIVCYVGAGVYKALSGKEKTIWGFQTVSYLPGIIDFVAPNTSGLVRIPLAEQVAIFAELRSALDTSYIINRFK